MNELLEAWNAWLDGRLNDSYLLWNLEIFWWGRIGKFMQAIAIVTIFVEVIGARRLREYGSSLHSFYSVRGMKDLFIDSFHHQATWLQYMFGSGKKAELALEKAKNYRAHNLHVIVVALFYIAVVMILFLLEKNLLGSLVIALFITGIFAFFSGTITFFLVTFVSVIGFVVDSLLIKPLAWLISHKEAERFIKIGTLVTAIIGLHFDFLAS